MKNLLLCISVLAFAGCTSFTYRKDGVVIRYVSTKDNAIGEFRLDPVTGEVVLKRATGNSSDVVEAGASGLVEGAGKVLSKLP